MAYIQIQQADGSWVTVQVIDNLSDQYVTQQAEQQHHNYRKKVRVITDTHSVINIVG